VTNVWINALAALAALASVILGILQYRARRPLLRATVYVHDNISLPIFLKNDLRQLWRDEQPSGEAPTSDKLGNYTLDSLDVKPFPSSSVNHNQTFLLCCNGLATPGGDAARRSECGPASENFWWLKNIVRKS
jgi:hypothetical protein